MYVMLPLLAFLLLVYQGFVVLMITVLVIALVEVIKPAVRTSAIFTNSRVYFTDPSDELRTWEEAREFCASEGGELAKITNQRLYDTMRLSLSIRSTYWIDGIEKNTTDRFALENPCGEFLDFRGINPVNVDLSPKQCMSLVKGSNSATSKIQAEDFVIPHRVLCAFKSDGCNITSTQMYNTNYTMPMSV